MNNTILASRFRKETRSKQSNQRFKVKLSAHKRNVSTCSLTFERNYININIYIHCDFCFGRALFFSSYLYYHFSLLVFNIAGENLPRRHRRAAGGKSSRRVAFPPFFLSGAIYGLLRVVIPISCTFQLFFSFFPFL